MKKKKLLGILAILMMIALALTGCGQQGEQNAGTTGSESQNSTIDEGSVDEGEVTIEPEEPTVDIGEMPDGSDPMELRAWYYKRDMAYIETVEKDADGYYHYKVGDKELLCKTNVWDFIEKKDGKSGTYYVWHFEDMAKSIGLYPSDFETQYTVAAKTSLGNERWDFVLNCGEAFENPYGQTVVQYVGDPAYLSNDEAVYRVSSVIRWAVSLKQICFAAYDMEQIQSGRSERQIMDDEFSEWYDGHNNYIIP